MREISIEIPVSYKRLEQVQAQTIPSEERTEYFNQAIESKSRFRFAYITPFWTPTHLVSLSLI